jgi:hypothetical protein
MRDALQKNKEAAQKTLDNANKGLSRSGKPISPEQAAKVQKTMQDRINNVNNILQSGCQGGKN